MRDRFINEADCKRIHCRPPAPGPPRHLPPLPTRRKPRPPPHGARSVCVWEGGMHNSRFHFLPGGPRPGQKPVPNSRPRREGQPPRVAVKGAAPVPGTGPRALASPPTPPAALPRAQPASLLACASARGADSLLAGPSSVADRVSAQLREVQRYQQGPRAAPAQTWDSWAAAGLGVSTRVSAQVRARLGFPGGSVGKNPPANAGDLRDSGSIPGLGRSPGGGNGNPLQRLPGEPYRQRSLAGYGPWGHTGLDTTEVA